MPFNANVIVYFLLFILAYQVYSVYSVRSKIWCSFRRADRTKIERWAKKDQQRIEFDGGWYHVEPDRTTLMIKWMPLPMWIRCLDFRHGSSRALHPDTFDSSMDDVERKRLDISDDIRAYDEGSRKAYEQKGKVGLLQQWLPIILLIGMLFIGYMVYQQQKRVDMLGLGQNVIESQLQKIIEGLR